MPVKTTLFAGVLLVLLGSVAAHVSLSSPPPRRSANLPGANYQNIDYSMTAPIGTEDHASQPFCKGYPAGAVGATYAAGSTINVVFQVGAAHGGGACQYALSYDDGKTFAVIKTDTQCLVSGSSTSVTIPADAPPSDHVVFAWTWLNNLGNREYYMNCADIVITGGKQGGSVTGKQLLVANYPGYPGLPENLAGVEPLLAARGDITVSVPDNYQPVTDYSTVSFPVLSSGGGSSNAPAPPVYPTTASSSVLAVSSTSAVYPTAAGTDASPFTSVYPTTSPSAPVYPTTSAAPANVMPVPVADATSTSAAATPTGRRCRVYKRSARKRALKQ